MTPAMLLTNKNESMRQAIGDTFYSCETLASDRKDRPDLIIINKRRQFAIQGYTDASFAPKPDTRTSTTGCLFLLGGARIIYGAQNTDIDYTMNSRGRTDVNQPRGKGGCGSFKLES